MKRAIILLALISLAAARGRANILIAFDNPNQTGSPGDTLIFRGVLSNGGPDTVFLNSDTLNLLGSGLLVTDLFFTTVPFSLDSGQSSGDIELFDVLIKNPFTDLPGAYAGTYAALGGVDSNAQDVLGLAGFTATAQTVPEPSTVSLLFMPLSALFGLLHHRRNSLTLRQQNVGQGGL